MSIISALIMLASTVVTVPTGTGLAFEQPGIVIEKMTPGPIRRIHRSRINAATQLCRERTEREGQDVIYFRNCIGEWLGPNYRVTVQSDT